MSKSSSRKEELSDCESTSEINLSYYCSSGTESVICNISTLDYNDSSISSIHSEKESSSSLTKNDKSLKNSPLIDIFLYINSKVHDDKMPSNQITQFSNSESKTLEKEKYDIVQIFSTITKKKQEKSINHDIKKHPLETKNILEQAENFDTKNTPNNEKPLNEIIKSDSKIQELYNNPPSIIILECIDKDIKIPYDKEKHSKLIQKPKRNPKSIYTDSDISKYANLSSSNSIRKNKIGYMSCARCLII
ncbi:hypothetical protein SteCoe_21239 [Stentor coeruleus]|uniref:Uncharacterized protein n=1 Tax=Stentor coeruleus TaxID=5963 RepID=A0A1R2BQ11_9CILI|nr:hypothetical protein SteCoe_21239 [Stentor coeruleus]